MTGVFPATAPSRRFPAEPASVPLARRFIRTALAGAEADLVETAQLLLSELVTNAIMHAGSPLEVRVWAQAPRLHVRVSDSAADRPLVPRQFDPDASTGRGLQLVQMLAASYGVDRDAGGKTVWFELWAGVDPVDVRSADWRYDVAVDPGSSRLIQLQDVPLGLFRAAQRHRDSLLRECRLHALGHGDLFGISRDVLVAAAGLHDLITEGVAAQVGRHEAGDTVALLEVTVPLACAGAVDHLRTVLETANDRARSGAFLTRPALPEIREFRHWMLDEITGQLQGRPPTPWPQASTAAAGAGATTGQHGEWHALDVDDSPVATIAASDDNVIVAVNAAALSLLGWTSDTLIGQRVVAIIPPRMRQQHAVGFTNFLLTGDPRILGSPVRVPALRRDGTEVAVDLLVAVRQSGDGRPVFVAELSPAEPA